MKIRLFTLVFFLSLCFQCLSQNIDREKLYIHFNSTYLLTGETLQFSLFTTNVNSGQLAEISKVAYVELINKDGKPVFQKKVSIENGRGFSEFFISSLVSTGSYQLIAYTKWMRNFEDYFIQEIKIVNPFENYEPKPLTELAKPQIEFYPEGKSLVDNKSNLLVYQITGNRAMVKSIRLINQQNETLQTLSFDDKGFGRIIFNPSPGEDYKVILEDLTGDFEFINVPKTGQNPVIKLANNGDAYKIEILENSTQSTRYQLKLSNTQNEEIWSQSVFSNAPVLLDKSLLKAGLYALSSDKEGVKSRVFYHGTDNSSVTNKSLGRYANRTKIEYPLKYEAGTSLSFSVRRMDALSSNAPSSLQNQLFGDTDLKELNLGLDNSNALYIDNLLVSSGMSLNSTINASMDFLPEVRGEIISGSIAHSSKEIENVEVFVAFVGGDHHVFLGKTNAAGQFAIQIDGLSGNQLAYVGTTTEDDGYQITVDQPFLTKYPKLDFERINLDSALIAEIVERSVRNQIENAYYEPFSYTTPIKVWDTFGEFNNSYLLDDYNRFPQLHEHFIEYIPSVTARKNKTRSKITVNLRNYISGYDPLVLLDGIPTDVDRLFEFSPYKIQKIEIFDNRLYLGSGIFDGVVSLHTFDQDLMGFGLTDAYAKINFVGLDLIPNYTYPTYIDSTLDRIPNQKDQLYWNPEINLTEDSNFFVEFYTGDVEGKYEITIEGYTAEGEAISVKSYFEVATNSQDAN